MTQRPLTSVTAVIPDGHIATAQIFPAEDGSAPLLTLSDGRLHLSCRIESSLQHALGQPLELANVLMSAAGCPPDMKACTQTVRRLALEARRRRKISADEASFLIREAIGLIEEARDQDALPDLLMERFWGADWHKKIPRLPCSTRERLRTIAEALNEKIKAITGDGSQPTEAN